MELLNDAGSRHAAANPISGAHSMWKIVLHIAAWTGAALCRVSGKTVDLTPAQDWPPAVDASDESWRAPARTLAESKSPLPPSSPLSGEHSVSRGPNRSAEEEMR